MKNEQLATISIDQLDNVTGGAGWGDFFKSAASGLGSMFGGGTNINAQIGNNQRSANGNTGPVSLGDNSGITVNQPQAPQGQ
ncbi:MAG TPA: hypothetical protein VL326_06345 [Kofleriaceae bacterium]|jgi:hypothetical protein|nr:hypothetical protein [Kofleriaceae bacterium]